MSKSPVIGRRPERPKGQPPLDQLAHEGALLPERSNLRRPEHLKGPMPQIKEDAVTNRVLNVTSSEMKSNSVEGGRIKTSTLEDVEPEPTMEQRMQIAEDRIAALGRVQLNQGDAIEGIKRREAHNMQNGGVSGTAKHWPVVTSQIIAAIVNALILVSPATWAELPEPWNIVFPILLQAIAAAIGGQFTRSKAELGE